MSDTIPKSEVARVLAVEYRVARTNLLAIVLRCIAQELNLRPEFESALKALEEAGRG